MRLRRGSVKGLDAPSIYDEYREYEERFNSFSIETITNLLREDMEFITGEQCDEEYFRKALDESKLQVQLNEYKKMYMDLWLSQQGHVREQFGDGFHYGRLDFYHVYLPSFEGKVVMHGDDSHKIAENEAKGRFLQRIEYNLRAYDPGVRVFVSDTHGDFKNIFKNNFKIYFFLSDQENGRKEIHAWEDWETDRTVEDNLGRKLTKEERAELTGAKSTGLMVYRIALLFAWTMAVGFIMSGCQMGDIKGAEAFACVVVASFLVWLLIELDIFNLNKQSRRNVDKYIRKLKQQDEEKNNKA